MSTLPPGLRPAPPVLTFSLHTRFEQGLEVRPALPAGCRALSSPPLPSPPRRKRGRPAVPWYAKAALRPPLLALPSQFRRRRRPTAGTTPGRQEVRGAALRSPCYARALPPPGPTRGGWRQERGRGGVAAERAAGGPGGGQRPQAGDGGR